MRKAILGLSLLMLMSLTGATPTEASKENAVEFVVKTQLPVGSSEETQREAKPYIPLVVFTSGDKQIVVQQGSFNCIGNTHRSFLIAESGLVIPACSEVKDNEVIVTLETGLVIKIPHKSVNS